MHVFFLYLLPFFTALQLITALPDRANLPQTYDAGLRYGTDPCTDVHLILARGSTEVYPGRQHRLIRAVCNAQPDELSCDHEDIVYRATFENWCDSVVEGVEYGREAVMRYAERCPASAIVLAGFSQGTQVIGDILGGGGGEFPKSGNLKGGDCVERQVDGIPAGGVADTKIAAAILFGDVRHTANQVYNIGDGSHKDGAWPRVGAQLEALNRFSNVLGSWCGIGDVYCALGNDLPSHVNYLRVISDEAAQFVRRKVEEYRRRNNLI